MKKIFVLLCFVIIFFPLKSQKIIGFAKTYKGLSINIFRVKDYITSDTLHIANFQVNDSGYFSVDLHLKKTQIIYFDLEYYWGYMYVVPGENYAIILPERRQKSDLEIIDPFFEPAIIPIFIKYMSEPLNYYISKFDSAYNSALVNSLNIRKKVNFDTIKSALEKCCSECKNPYFKIYKKYKISALSVYKNPNIKYLTINELYCNSEIHYDNEAYMKLFTTLFDGIFQPQKTTLDINCIYKAIGKKSFELLNQCLEQEEICKENPEFMQLLILYGLDQLFYSLPEAQFYILDVLRQISIKSKYQNIRQLASNIYRHHTVLMKNFPAPPFQLPDKKGKLIKLSDFAGKFLYIQFCHPKSYPCLKDLPVLDRFWKTRPQNFEILTIFVGESQEQMKQFLKQNKYKWTFVFWNFNQNLLAEYQVRGMPSYYLIYPDGTLAFKYAKPPTEDFENQYKQAVKEWKEKQQAKYGD